jgi:glycogen operon protein
MSEEDFNTSHRRSLGMFLNGKAIQGRDLRGQSVRDDSFLVIMNANAEKVVWKLPSAVELEWSVVVDTSGDLAEGTPLEDGSLLVAERSTVVLTSAN